MDIKPNMKKWVNYGWIYFFFGTWSISGLFLGALCPFSLLIYFTLWCWPAIISCLQHIVSVTLAEGQRCISAVLQAQKRVKTSEPDNFIQLCCIHKTNPWQKSSWWGGCVRMPLCYAYFRQPVLLPSSQVSMLYCNQLLGCNSKTHTKIPSNITALHFLV